jgi:23S rRNA (cytosine1962-C5)-methyltransferase
VASALRLSGVVRGADEGGFDVLYGESPPPALTVFEHGLRFLVRPGTGQKTGLFLDQRENRASVRRFAAGRRLANLFSYTGGFSIHALAGGAEHAIDVDVAAGALADATANAASNGFAARHSTLKLDLMGDPSAALAHAELSAADFWVLDPPSFARNKTQRHAALRAYKRLNVAAMARVPDGGLLATASCTAQVSPEAFREMLAAAIAEAASKEPGLEARIVLEAGHAADHPVPLPFPEGRYLKFLLLRIDRSR